MDKVLTALWATINTPAGITLLATVMILLINKWLKPLWEKYRGTITQAIKFAEKAIPDDTTNAGLARFDWALKYALKVIAESENTTADKIPLKVVNALKEGINIVHDQLESEELV